MACNATLGNPRHVGENTYLVKVIEIFSDIEGKNIPDFKIDILRKMSEEELGQMDNLVEILADTVANGAKFLNYVGNKKPIQGYRVYCHPFLTGISLYKLLHNSS